MFILVIFTMILPYIVDSVIHMYMIEDHPPNTRGNSTFVLSPTIEKRNDFQQNLYNLTKYYLY